MGTGAGHLHFGAMSHTVTRSDRPRVGGMDGITRWLLLVAALIALMVVVGGFTRLSRAGLSIVEWDAVTGVVPPIGDQAWQEAFTAYQQTPEYRLVNQGMSLEAFQQIYYIEWAHRLIARIAGLMVVLPLLWLMGRRRLSLRESLPYWGIAALFGIQGVIGWVMVSSGLQDRPSVSHYRLTIHLLTALALLALVLWMALDRMSGRVRGTTSRTVRRLAWTLLGVLVLQISYGGLVAGLKAGYLSNTWPLMSGRLVPSGLFSSAPPWADLVAPLGAHWVHRWFAFVVAGVVLWLASAIYREAPALRRAAGWLVAVVAAQITLGIAVVLLGVPKWLALAHQGLAVVLFTVALVIVHDTRTRAVAPVEAGSPVAG